MAYDDCPAGGAPAREHGGCEFAAPVTVADDDRALSVLAAADDAGDAPALRVDGRTFGFAELAGLVRARGSTPSTPSLARPARARSSAAITSRPSSRCTRCSSGASRP